MITHDICQPWEVEVAKLKKQLEEAEEVIGFYGCKTTHGHNCGSYLKRDLRRAPMSDVEKIEGANYAGKRAREYQQKYGEKK